jgi:hypothetical protein
LNSVQVRNVDQYGFGDEIFALVRSALVAGSGFLPVRRSWLAIGDWLLAQAEDRAAYADRAVANRAGGLQDLHDVRAGAECARA